MLRIKTQNSGRLSLWRRHRNGDDDWASSGMYRKTEQWKTLRWNNLHESDGNCSTRKWLISFSLKGNFIVLCGHYKGIDEHPWTFYHKRNICRNYVLSGGELAAAVVCDAIIRLLQVCWMMKLPLFPIPFRMIYWLPGIYTSVWIPRMEGAGYFCFRKYTGGRQMEHEKINRTH